MLQQRHAVTAAAASIIVAVLCAAVAAYQWERERRLRVDLEHLLRRQISEDGEQQKTNKDTGASLVVKKDRTELNEKKVETITKATKAINTDPDESISVVPIGRVRSVFRLCVGTPRQGMLSPNSRGRIDLDPSLLSPDAFDCLNQYSHVWILFLFHLNTNLDVSRKFASPDGFEHEAEGRDVRGTRVFPSKVSPPALGGKRVGLFATRTPHRPNPVGLSLCKLDGVEMGDDNANRKRKKNGCRVRFSLHVSGIDLVDGTPVIDIKPYVPRYDAAYGFRAGERDEDDLDDEPVELPNWVRTGLEKRRKVTFTSDAEEQLESIVRNRGGVGRLEFYGRERKESVTDALRAIKSCISDVLAVDVRSSWQTRKAREGKFQAERALKDILPVTVGGDCCDGALSAEKEVIGAAEKKDVVPLVASCQQVLEHTSNASTNSAKNHLIDKEEGDKQLKNVKTNQYSNQEQVEEENTCDSDQSQGEAQPMPGGDLQQQQNKHNPESADDVRAGVVVDVEVENEVASSVEEEPETPLCTQQIDNLLIHFAVTFPVKLDTDNNDGAAAAFSGSDDQVEVRLIQRILRRDSAGDEESTSEVSDERDSKEGASELEPAMSTESGDSPVLVSSSDGGAPDCGGVAKKIDEVSTKNRGDDKSVEPPDQSKLDLDEFNLKHVNIVGERKSFTRVELHPPQEFNALKTYWMERARGLGAEEAVLRSTPGGLALDEAAMMETRSLGSSGSRASFTDSPVRSIMRKRGEASATSDHDRKVIPAASASMDGETFIFVDRDHTHKRGSGSSNEDSSKRCGDVVPLTPSSVQCLDDEGRIDDQQIPTKTNATNTEVLKATLDSRKATTTEALKERSGTNEDEAVDTHGKVIDLSESGKGEDASN